MTKAFIFDFDGVIINNELTWEDVKRKMYKDLFGQEVFLCLGSTVGINMDDIYKKALNCGATIKKEIFIKEFFSHAPEIYKHAPLTPGVDEIGKKLVDLGYEIGIVSASPLEWINMTLDRTTLKKYTAFVLSLYDRKDLAHKPAPDGYIEAMKFLKTKPCDTIILEDSNSGIESAKAAGAYTIGFRQNLTKGYIQKNADSYADNFSDVIKIIKNK